MSVSTQPWVDVRSNGLTHIPFPTNSGQLCEKERQQDCERLTATSSVYFRIGFGWFFSWGKINLHMYALENTDKRLQNVPGDVPGKGPQVSL